MKSVIFASILILFIPLFLSAQENIVAQQDYIKNDLNIYLDKSVKGISKNHLLMPLLKSKATANLGNIQYSDLLDQIQPTFIRFYRD